MLAAEGRLKEAWERSAETSTMPEICGRICPQDRLCEGACVIEQSRHGAVTIGSVETYLTETAFREGWVKPLAPKTETGWSAGIVGAGPAGLAAAERLREAGCAVTVYDRHDRAGGLLVYGIPNFKLDKDVVARRIARLEEGGVVFELGVEIGRDLSFDEVRARHDSVLIATGVYAARQLSCPVGAPVAPALDYLVTANRAGFGESGTGPNADGRNVVVIGGGDTAMDCVRTAIRQGAKSVTCLYRRDRENMPGSAREVAHAEEEGVVFEWLSAPAAVMGDQDRASAVRVQKMRLGAPDMSGRRMPEAAPEDPYEIRADLVVAALGFEPEDLPAAFACDDLAVSKWKTIATTGRSATSVPGVFAAGDIVRGASLVVWAVKDGQDAAADMLAHMAAHAAPKAAE